MEGDYMAYWHEVYTFSLLPNLRILPMRIRSCRLVSDLAAVLCKNGRNF